jgi:hypothetical protein
VTGYLQRLVTTAVQGKAGVHPIVRPPRVEPEGLAWNEVADEAEPHLGEGAAPAEVAAATPTATQLPGQAEAPGNSRPPPIAGHAHDRTAAEPSGVPETMTPLFGETAAADPATPVLAARMGSAVRPAVARRSRPSQRADHPIGPARGPSAPADATRSGLQPATPRSDPAALTPFRQEPQRWAWPATSWPAAEGAGRGDVEIHIGRIEVTAVSPPPPAPAAKAARKSINLNEYLRNGR